jgi:maltose/moltooligosaccharide transporter
MVVDMTEDARIGTYTGLYYLFSTWQPSPGRTSTAMIMAIGPVFMLLAFIMMMGVRRGEAKVETI